jgi:hypothetical protein
MLLATTGCSNSSQLVGDSWPVFLSEKLCCDVIRSYSCGAGNEINIEKVAHIIDNYSPDALVVQLTESSRWVWGLNITPSINDTDTLLDGRHFEDAVYYTANPVNNTKNIYNITNHQLRDDIFLRECIMTSVYNTEIKPIHAMSAIFSLCNAKNIKVFFFNWFDNSFFDRIKNSHWKNVFPADALIKLENVSELLYRKFPESKAPCGHFYPEAHKFLVDTYLYPHIKKSLHI